MSLVCAACSSARQPQVMVRVPIGRRTQALCPTCYDGWLDQMLGFDDDQPADDAPGQGPQLSTVDSADPVDLEHAEPITAQASSTGRAGVLIRLTSSATTLFSIFGPGPSHP